MTRDIKNVFGPFCEEHQECVCRSYPMCDGCNAHQPRPKTTKENDMNFNDVKIMIGNKIIDPYACEVTQTVGDYPRLEIEAYASPRYVHTTTPKDLTITNVIFNPPATVVFWSDKTKTVVKCDYEHELYDPEKGLAMAISRKMLGDNKREYYNTFLHWLKKWDKQKTLDDLYTEEEWNGEMYNA